MNPTAFLSLACQRPAYGFVPAPGAVQTHSHSTERREQSSSGVWPCIATKIMLAPSFVVGASLIARRFGVRVGGLVGALPVVAGPILLVYAFAHGRVFAADAAAGTLLGLVSLTTFVVVYAHLAGRGPGASACSPAGSRSCSLRRC